jgi:hypothetical protein
MIETDDFFTNQTELGRLFGVSCKIVGDWLFNIGLRTIGRNGKKVPSRAAFEGAFVRQADNGRNGCYYYVWHREKTLAALVKAGYKPVIPQQDADQPIRQDRLVGPFESRINDAGVFEMVGADGSVAALVRGDGNAEKVVNLLNLAFRHGRLD